MEADTRRVQPVKIGMSSVETGKERFTSNGLLSLPRASTWRNNLTALSQRYNLYFVALETSIRVYQPCFPFQTVGSKPCLTIPPTLAEPNAHGYIDARQSHTINHVIVGDLGTEEILLVATDSGNVAAYHTKAIRDAIKRDPYKYSADARSDFVGVRAFFSHWVHESAWGLAIHKKARMIAVSANTPYHTPAQDDHAKITVFAFALTGQADSQEGDNHQSNVLLEQPEWKAWEPNPYEPWLGDRSRNYKTILSGHIDNIPNISFVNSNHDRDGSWLLSTDIGGRMKLWHIWIRRCYKSWDFSIPENPASALENVVERGWLVVALDPACFISADTLEELCGSPRPPKYHKHTETAESYDVTNWVRTRVPNTSQLHPAFGALDDDGAEERNENDVDLLEEFSSDDESADFAATDAQLGTEAVNNPDVGEEEVVEDGNVQPGENVEEPEGEEDRLAEGLSSNEADQVLNFIHVVQDSPQLEPMQLEPMQSPSEDELDHFEENSSMEDEDLIVAEREEMQPSTDWATVAQANAENVFPEELDIEQTTYIGPPKKKPKHSDSYKEVYETFMAAKAVRASAGLQPIAPLSVIQCSASHIRLINVPKTKTPHFFCAQALRQTLPRTLERSPLVHMDRLNMMQYVPELGIVIIATQIGRCAVCTLTKKSDTGTTGFRVDWILPTKEQERQGLRPAGPLLGIAAGPIQGRQIGEEQNSPSDVDSGSEAPSSSSSERNHFSEGGGGRRQRRQKHRRGHRPRPPQIPFNNRLNVKPESWHGIEHSRRHRLMLTYYEQTVLTYEIWREAPEIGIDGRRNWRNRSSGMV